MKNLYDEILRQSKPIDVKFKKISDRELLHFSIRFGVPSFHPRWRVIKSYTLKVTQVSKRAFSQSAILFVDKGVVGLPFLKNILPTKHLFAEKAQEETFKEWGWLHRYLDKHDVKQSKAHEIVGLGGGLTLNVAAYIAELLGARLTLIPTTIIGMADSNGGKVRLNMIDRGRSIKHYYKSYYEPDTIIVDPRFLDTLNSYHISTGLGEIIKHGVYQSKPLLDFLLSKNFDPGHNKKSLLRVILWSAALKAACLKVDVEENANGSRKILRGGHEFSDRIEEDTNFRVPHGLAVAMGIYREMEMSGSELLPQFLAFVKRFKIPKTVEEFNQIYQRSS